MATAGVVQPRAGPSDGSKMRVERKPGLRVRQAVRDNHVSLLTRLQAKTDLRNTDKNRLTSLSWAAIEGSLEVFEWLLLEYGHDDQELSRDSDNNTILHLLASVPSVPSLSPHSHLLSASPHFPPRPTTRSHSEQVDVCLRMTHDYHTLFPFLLDWSNSGGKTALHVAAQAGNHAFISLLCDFGADVDLTDLQGNTPLHYASAWGHVETIKVLLERGCQPTNRNYEGFSAADFAYSNTVLGALQTIAREVAEGRRRRRVDSNRTQTDGRLRSGSGATNLSTGSGSAVSINPPPSMRSARSRDSETERLPPPPQPPSRPTSSGRPLAARSPSLPLGPSPRSTSPQPPVPALPPGAAMGSVSMRRANSAQTGSSVGSGSTPARKPGSGTGGRGTPI